MIVPPVASAQDGVFTRRQATEAGMTRWIVTARLREQVWQTVLADVYALGAVPVTPRMRARAAALATGGVVSHESAAFLHALGLPPPTLPHVTTRRDVRIAVAGTVEHRLRLDPRERTVLAGIPVTTRRRTLVDLLATSPRGDATTLLFRAVQQSWITPAQLADDIGARRHMTGTPQLRELAAMLGTGAHSVAERALHDVLATIEGLRWRANVPLTLRTGERVVVDVLIDEARLVIEVDGRRFHGADRFQSDRSRQNALVGSGYSVLRFTWWDVVERPGYVRRTVDEQRAA
jgi:very-short-patch-repair endonuclease